MKTKINRLVLSFFKGAEVGDYSFSDQTVIKGRNGSGKTTIAEAWYWLISNKNYSMADNPAIRPEGSADEIATAVIAEIEVDEKPITISKVQRLKRTGEKVALTNSYTVNDVPKSERDFKSYLEDLGFDFGHLLPLSHPYSFLDGINNKKQRDAVRNTLFGMVEDISDIDIARQTPETADVARLLENYTVDEINAMQSATLRKIRENYGKDGEILRAQIQGKLELKKNIDSEEITRLEEKKAELEEKVSAAIEAKTKKIALKDEITALKYSLKDAYMNGNSEALQKKQDSKDLVNSITADITECRHKIAGLGAKVEADRMLMDEINHLAKGKVDEQKTIEAMAFDDGGLICPTCGQEYPSEKALEIMRNFENKNMADIAAINEQIESLRVQYNTTKSRVESQKAEIESEQKRMDGLRQALAMAEESCEKWREISMNDIPECVEIKSQIFKLEQEFDVLDVPYDAETESELIHIKHDLDELKASIKQNDVIDGQVEDLRTKQMEYEQSKADAEKIQYELQLLSKAKNEQLENEVNSHFHLVKWQLFDQKKNGEFFDTCIPTINGKRFGESMNTGLETLARLDIINGLQKHYNEYYPVFLDEAEHLSENTRGLINLDCQLIELMVTNDDLTVI